MKLIAAQGKVQMQAQHGEVEATSEQDFTLTSCQGKVVMAAKEEILLTAGGGYIRIKDGNIDIHCPATASFKGASHQWSGPASLAAAMPEMPISAPGHFSEQLKIIDPITGKMQKTVIRWRRRG